VPDGVFEQQDSAVLLNANVICSSEKYYFAIREPILFVTAMATGITLRVEQEMGGRRVQTARSRLATQ
jgi:hypothetical protein